MKRWHLLSFHLTLASIGSILEGVENKEFLKVIELVGSKSELANLLGYSESHIRALLCGAKNVPAKIVLKLVELSNGAVTAQQLRPDIFYSKGH